MAGNVIEPELGQVLEFCARDPVERVFLQDAASRGFGRFVGIARPDGTLDALCHVGVNLVPSGNGCAAFASAATSVRVRMIIGEERAVGELWAAAARSLTSPREDRPGQPVYTISEPPPDGKSGLRPAEPADFERLLPACAAAHTEELGIDPLARDPESFRWRTRAQIDEGRSWLWLEDGVDPLQGRSLSVDAGSSPGAAGLGRPAGARARPRNARDAGTLPAAARAHTRRDAVRPPRQLAGDPSLRDDWNASRPLLPQHLISLSCSAEM